MTTTPDFADRRVVEVKGACYGAVLRGPGSAGGAPVGYQPLPFGNVGGFVQSLEESRGRAMYLLAERARALGGNAVVGLRFDSGPVDENLSEVVAYGTAVVVARDGA